MVERTGTSTRLHTEEQGGTLIVKGVPVYFSEFGHGRPVLAIHGWMGDHHAVFAFAEPVFVGRGNYRRIYVDLPGMGKTPAPESIASSDDLLDVLDAFVTEVLGDEPFLLLGQSYGGYLARGLTVRRRDQVAGLALVNPFGSEVMSASPDVPEHVVIHRSGERGGILDDALGEMFDGYFVVHTPEAMRAFRDQGEQAVALADRPALERIQQRFPLSVDPADGPPFERPSLIVTGRQDATVGYAAAYGWLDGYPRAAFAVLDRAGHVLSVEQGPLLAALLGEWLDRVEEEIDAT